MIAPAGYQKGSFRGVPFTTENQEQRGGQRGVLHQFPQADLPVWEALGREADSFTIDCHVKGADYLAAANALVDALKAPGVGTLIHPWYGSMQVAAQSWTRSDSTAEGGFTAFSIDFVESGLPAVPAPTSDTASIARTVATEEAAAAPTRFADRFDLSRAAGFVESAASKVVSAAALATEVQAGLLGGGGPALRAFQSAVGPLGLGGASVRNALGLGVAILGAVQTMALVGSSLPGRVSALTALVGWGDDLPPVIGATPARAQERANQAAIVDMVNIAAGAGLVAAIADTRFASYQDAVAMRDRVSDLFDVRALRQADAGDDAGAAAYDALARTMARDVTTRGGALDRVQVYVPATTEPALVIAHRLYGPTAGASRADEIVARNRIAHPGFVPGGRPLQVLIPNGPANG